MSKRKTLDDYDTSSEDEAEYLEPSRRRKSTAQSSRRNTSTSKRKRGFSGDDDGSRARSLEATTSICSSLAELDVGSELDFDETIGDSIPNFLEARDSFLRSQVEVNQLGQKLRPLTVSEARALMQSLQLLHPSNSRPINRLLLRKLKLERHRRLHSLPAPRFSLPASQTLEPPEAPVRQPLPDGEVLEALRAIRTTPYERSLAARIAGFTSMRAEHGYLHRDWEARAPWMDLMDDIHEHYSLLYPDGEQASRPAAPIDYQSLSAVHLPQVHELLARTFWPGIDVSDSLQYSPEQCTVVATYRRLVVGVAILSSPQETYLTYLAVRAGWENAGIATNMLYTLIARNPRRDILLHVSANNPAMLLYNRFGFKAEEFVVGFYEDYLDSISRASKNAVRMRWRC